MFIKYSLKFKQQYLKYKVLSNNATIKKRKKSTSSVKYPPIQQLKA